MDMKEAGLRLQRALERVPTEAMAEVGRLASVGDKAAVAAAVREHLMAADAELALELFGPAGDNSGLERWVEDWVSNLSGHGPEDTDWATSKAVDTMLLRMESDPLYTDIVASTPDLESAVVLMLQMVSARSGGDGDSLPEAVLRLMLRRVRSEGLTWDYVRSIRAGRGPSPEAN